MSDVTGLYLIHSQNTNSCCVSSLLCIFLPTPISIWSCLGLQTRNIFIFKPRCFSTPFLIYKKRSVSVVLPGNDLLKGWVRTCTCIYLDFCTRDGQQLNVWMTLEAALGFRLYKLQWKVLPVVSYLLFWSDELECVKLEGIIGTD